MTMALTSPGFYVIACAWVMASFASPGGLLETGRLAPTSGLVRRVGGGISRWSVTRHFSKRFGLFSGQTSYTITRIDPE